MTDRRIDRREFLRTSAAVAAACAAPSIVPARALGADGNVAPSNRITVGFIGVGRQGLCFNLPYFMSQPDCEVVALCDADRWRLAVTEGADGLVLWREEESLSQDSQMSALRRFPRGAWPQGRGHRLHRCAGPLARADVDHGRQGGERRFLREAADAEPGRRPVLSDLVTKHKRVFRTDSEFRSLPQFHRAVELVRNGRIGKVHTIRTTVPWRIKIAAICRHAGARRTQL